jgi:hypothetical protein
MAIARVATTDESASASSRGNESWETHSLLLREPTQQVRRPQPHIAITSGEDIAVDWDAASDGVVSLESPTLVIPILLHVLKFGVEPAGSAEAVSRCCLGPVGKLSLQLWNRQASVALDLSANRIHRIRSRKPPAIVSDCQSGQ